MRSEHEALYAIAENAGSVIYRWLIYAFSNFVFWILLGCFLKILESFSRVERKTFAFEKQKFQLNFSKFQQNLWQTTTPTQFQNFFDIFDGHLQLFFELYFKIHGNFNSIQTCGSRSCCGWKWLIYQIVSFLLKFLLPLFTRNFMVHDVNCIWIMNCLNVGND